MSDPSLTEVKRTAHGDGFVNVELRAAGDWRVFLVTVPADMPHDEIERVAWDTMRADIAELHRRHQKSLSRYV